MLITLHKDVLLYMIDFLSNGDRAILRYTCSRFCLLIPATRITCTDFIYDLRLLEWATSRGCPFEQNTVKQAILRDSLPILDYLFDKKCIFPSHLDRIAVSTTRSSLDMIATLSWLHQHYMLEPTDRDVLTIAARHVSMQVFRWLINHNYYWRMTSCGFAAAAGNSPDWKEIIDYVTSLNADIKYCACDGAVSGGHWDRLVILVEAGYPLEQNIYAYAIRGRNLKIMEYLRIKGTVMQQTTFEDLVGIGLIDLIEWAHRYFTFTPALFPDDIYNSFDEKTIDWVYHNGYYFEPTIIGLIINSEHPRSLELLKYVHPRLHTLDRFAWQYASKMENTQIMMWLRQHNYPEE